MRKTAVLLVLALAILFVPGAQAADSAVASIGTAPAVCNSALMPESVEQAGIGGPIAPTCSTTADCGPYADVSCSYTGSGGSCTYQDRNCAVGERGWVQCTNQPRKECPICPQTECTPGQIEWRTTSVNCCPNQGSKAPAEKWQCSGSGSWFFTGETGCITTLCFAGPGG